MIDFAALFHVVSQNCNNQKKLQVKSALGVFYGLSADGYMRLSFLSKSKAPKLESTKILRVTQGEESKSVYWTCFDLLQSDAKSVYFTFCEDMLSAVTNILNEEDALNTLKKRYITWKTMFKQVQVADVSNEVIQGLFGEMYFLKNYMLENYSPNESIGGWSGADAKSKDYSISNEWFEVKTIGANINKVQISSLSQLSSTITGHLVVIKVESMSEEYMEEDSSISMLMSSILANIRDEITEELFLKKVKSVVGNITDKVLNAKYAVKSVHLYRVDDKFPRLQETNIPYCEIEDVKYTLNISSIEKFMEK